MTDTFPNTLVGPSSKERKYDRQLRLWAASGQQALERSRVLLVNSDGPWDDESSGVSGVVGVEALKNLVLPGIGSFTIVDPAPVTEPDLGVNFFIEEGSLGKSRAEETCRLLRELNPDVEGRFHSEPIAELLRDPEFLPRHELILVSGPMKRSSLNSLCKTAWGLGTPVIYTHSVGFYSTLSVQLPAEFPIVETHPDPEATEDLRLLNPWPELRAAASCISNLDSLDDHQHGHIPYVLLLLHYLEKWKETHNDTLPSNYKEKSEFKDLVRANERTTNPEGGEENFEEAAAAVLKSLNPFTLRSSIREIFEMDECKNLKQESTDFWIIAAAVKEFYQKHNELPLPGSLPDMKAQSENYLSLQNIYKAKARRDLEDVTRTVRQLEAQLSREVPVPEKDIEVFCKNAAHIKLVRGREIPNLDGDAHTVRTIRSHLADSESLMAIFFATRVLDIVVSEIQNGERDGSALDDEDTWIAHIDAAVNNLAQGDRTAIDDEARARIIAAVQELRRTEGGELHNTSALTGGLVAQEALKVLTRQYVPLDNTCIFDGVRSRSEMFRL